MAIMQVNIPERKPAGLGQMLGTGSMLWGAGKGIAGLFGPAEGAVDAGSGAEIWGAQIGPGGQAATSGGSAGAGESGMGAVGPMAAGTAGMAYGAASELGYAKKGESSGNAAFSSRGAGPSIQGGTGMAEAMSRRMDGMKGGNPADILMGGKDALGGLKLDDPTKQLIGRKLDLGLSQLFKLKA